MPIHKSYHSYLIESLKDPAEAAAYLDAVLEDGEFEPIFLALKNVAEARRSLIIETEEEYDRILALSERLTFKKDRTPEEETLHKLLVTLIESYESINYSMDASSPYEIL